MSSFRNQPHLLCRDCGVLYLLEPVNADTEAEPEGPSGSAVEFRSAHRGHHLELAHRLDEIAHSDRPLWDPMAVVLFQVLTEGGEVLTVRSARTSIDGPRLQRVVSATGLPSPTQDVIEFDTRLVRRALDRHFFPHSLSTRKLDAFVELLATVTREVPAAALEIAFDDPEHPEASFAPVPDSVCGLLLQRCRDLFDPWELERVIQFIDANRGGDGALALRVVHCEVMLPF
jgi:hypothetical protein